MGLDFPPVQSWNKSEPLALDSRVKSPIFWSIVKITKGTRPQSWLLRLPEAAATWGVAAYRPCPPNPTPGLIWSRSLRDPGLQAPGF